jgi:chorismate mutase
MTDAKDQLLTLRGEIDAVDRQIIRLLNQRASIAEKIGDVKSAAGLPVVELSREQEVVSKMVGLNEGPLPNASVQAIYERVMLEMRRIQEVRMSKGNE